MRFDTVFPKEHVVGTGAGSVMKPGSHIRNRLRVAWYLLFLLLAVQHTACSQDTGALGKFIGNAVIVSSAIRSLTELALRISTHNRKRESARQTKFAEVRRCPGCFWRMSCVADYYCEEIVGYISHRKGSPEKA